MNNKRHGNKMIWASGFGILFALLLPGCSDPPGPELNSYTEGVYIRVNQVGYLLSEDKIAVIGTTKNLSGRGFSIINESGEEVFMGTIGLDRGETDTPFRHNNVCDFSDFRPENPEPAGYRIKVMDGAQEYFSEQFMIFSGDNGAEYGEALASVLQFFRSQRCGNTDPLLHEACHPADAKLEEGQGQFIDATGGWHDAGDYVKYMITNTFACYELLLAYDYAKEFSFDSRVFIDESPADGVPDILAEARVGIDWILKMTAGYEAGDMYYQVGGVLDHSQNPRLPEKDLLANERPLYRGFGGNLLGRSVAVCALAYRAFAGTDAAYANACMERARALFAINGDYRNVQHSHPEDWYSEDDWQDDMVLGAAELYRVYKSIDPGAAEEYKSYAEDNVRLLSGDDIGWCNCDFLALAACYRVGIDADYCLGKIKGFLDSKKQASEAQAYFLSSEYGWGTVAFFTADAQKAIMYYCLSSGDDTYLSMANAQRDYLLGRNNWGISFIVGVGEKFPQRPHSQIDRLNYPENQNGAVVGGPTRFETWDKEIPYPMPDDRTFQRDVVYFDLYYDYLCNEVALDYAAPSVFLFMHTMNEIMKQ